MQLTQQSAHLAIWYSLVMGDSACPICGEDTAYHGSGCSDPNDLDSEYSQKRKAPESAWTKIKRNVRKSDAFFKVVTGAARIVDKIFPTPKP